MRLWGGRFSEENDQRVADFTRSIEVDRRTGRATTSTASIAHVRGLGRAGLLTGEEVDELVGGLTALAEDVAAGRIDWDPSLEDVHMNLEAALAARIGPVAGKLHTGRSRNDQVATDLRLWTRRAIDRLDAAILVFERALVELAERERDAILPGTTHIQPAQPVLFAHHLLAYVEMVERDRGRLADARRRANVSPLGRRRAGRGRLSAGPRGDRPGAGLRRRHRELARCRLRPGLRRRDARRRSRSGWSTSAGWPRRSPGGRTRVRVRPCVRRVLDRQRMMPNKKNPDPAELVRGRAARVIGALTGTLAMLKGLPLAYQRDLQEDKAPLFDAVAVYEASLEVMAGMLDTLPSTRDRMRAAATEGYTTATAVADALVRRGVPFRTAHHVVGSLVAHAEEAGVGLDELPDDTIAAALGAPDDPTAVALAAEPGIGEVLRAPRPR